MRNLFPLAALLLMAAAVGCGAPASPTTEPLATQPFTPEPTEAAGTITEAPTLEATQPANAATDLESFQSNLLAALENPRDYDALAGFMGEFWEVLIFRGNGEQYAPDAAVEQLRSYLLPPDNSFAWDASADMTAMLGQNPMEFYRGNAKGFVFSTGWGDGGADEAILVINQDAEGRFFWQGILYSPGGF